jgi:tripartite-type tricarboxylate transporter receptor subunit TctC
MRALFKALLLALAMATAASAAAASWPAKPITLVVPYVPGGSTDLISRLMAAQLESALKAHIVVDNRPGATGTIALGMVSQAPPDGYTLVTATDVIAILPYAYRNLSFDPRTSFTPISRLSTQPLVLAVNASLPVKSIADFIALAKARPGQLSFGTSGIGTAQHLTGELIKKVAGIDMTHVPYKGGGQAIVELAGGQVPAAVLGSSTVIPQARAGKVRILAVTSLRRSVALPDVPTLAESGFEGIDVSQWIGLLGPAKLPADIVERVNSEAKKILAAPALQHRLETAGFEAAPSSPRELHRLIEDGMARWGKLIEERHLRLSNY